MLSIPRRSRAFVPGRDALRNGAVAALACALSGKLGLLLAVPPGHLTDVRPVAGIALAVALLLGPGVGPGIALGTALAHLDLEARAAGGSTLLATLLLPGLIGIGEALQARIAAALVRRHARFPNTLTEPSDVLRFLALAGPTGAVIGSTVGVAGLLLCGKVSTSEIGFAWSTWWIGSAIGAALFAPIVLLWCSHPLRAGLRRKISVTAPLGMIFALAVILFLQVGARERERLAADFERRADDLANGLERRFDAALEVLDSLGSFYDAAGWVDHREFGTFARFALSHGRGVRSLSWCPRVKDSERPGCIRTGRLEVDPGFRILERSGTGALVPAAQRDEYVPTFYVETIDAAKPAVGLDALSDPERRGALDRARDEAELAATAPIPLTDEDGSGLIVYRPVYGHGEPHGTVAERRRCLAGFVSAELRIDEMAREALQGTEAQGVRLRLADITEPASERVLYADSPADPARADQATPRTSRYRIGGRVWELRFSPDRDLASVRHDWQSWFVLGAGLLFAGLLEAFLLVVTGRSDAIEALVARRTAELEQANADLRHQVSQRARAELSHQSSELRLAAAQQIAHLGSWEIDLEKKQVLWSDELYRIHGLEPGEATLGYGEFLSRVHPEDRGLVGQVLEAAVRDTKPFGIHCRIVRPDQDVRTLHVQGEVVLGPSGRPARIHGTGQDVTELKRAERELARRTLDLERSNAELERFAYVASHDLQEPLRAVASHVQILEQDYRGRLDDEADESIRCAVEGAQRMHDLINDYLAYSRVRSGSEPLQRSSSERALELALKNLERSIAESGARVTHDELPEVLADPTQLVQLLQNLVGNAVKFRGDDPPLVHVSAARAESTWLFSVRDNGIGIDPEHTRRIFTLFQRLHTQDRYPGTGIGLAICKKIVDRHAGRIWVESMPGMGSTFRFTLPACLEEIAVLSTPETGEHP